MEAEEEKEETQSNGAPGRRLGHEWCKGLWNQMCIYFSKMWNKLEILE